MSSRNQELTPLRPVVWDGAGAQSPAPDPIENGGNDAGAPTCGRLNALSSQSELNMNQPPWTDAPQSRLETGPPKMAETAPERRPVVGLALQK